MLVFEMPSARQIALSHSGRAEDAIQFDFSGLEGGRCDETIALAGECHQPFGQFALQTRSHTKLGDHEAWESIVSSGESCFGRLTRILRATGPSRRSSTRPGARRSDR